MKMNVVPPALTTRRRVLLFGAAGVAGGLMAAAVLIRTMEDVMSTPPTVGPTPLGVMEPLIYVVASRDRQ